MPMYQYSCPKCDYDEELLLGIRELDDKQLCKKCETEMKRVPTKGKFKVVGHKQYYQ